MTEGLVEITKIQAAILQNELSDGLSVAEEFRVIVKHMQIVYEAALASHAPSDPRCSNCKRLPSEYEPGMCSDCDWRNDHSSEATALASHAPSGQTKSTIAAEMYAVLERLIAAMERNDWDHETPALYQDAVNIFKKADGQASEAAAQPTRHPYSCCGAEFAKQHEPTCHHYQTKFEHDH